MKKLQKAMVLGLSLALAASLTACGDKGGKSTVAPPPSEIKSEQVTAEQWAAAFDFSKVTNATVEMSYKETDKDGAGSNVITLMLDGSKAYSKDVRTGPEEDDNRTREAYMAVENEVAYLYEYDETAKKWIKDETESSLPTLDDYVGGFDEYVEDFSKFTFDSEANAYTATFDDEDVSVKIKNGKLSVISSYTEREYEGEKETREMYYYFYNLGNTTVTLPEATLKEKDPAEVDQGAWQAALSEDAFKNVTYVGKQYAAAEPSDSSNLIEIDYANKLIKNTYRKDGVTVSTARIKQFANDEYRVYRFSDGVWKYEIYEENTADDFDSSFRSELTMFTTFKNEYGRFTFESGKYTLDEYTVAEGAHGTVLKDIELTFDNGKLVKFGCTVVSENGELITEVTLSAYGTTTVTVPTDATPEE